MNGGRIFLGIINEMVEKRDMLKMLISLIFCCGLFFSFHLLICCLLFSFDMTSYEICWIQSSKKILVETVSEFGTIFFFFQSDYVDRYGIRKCMLLLYIKSWMKHVSETLKLENVLVGWGRGLMSHTIKNKFNWKIDGF